MKTSTKGTAIAAAIASMWVMGATTLGHAATHTVKASHADNGCSGKNGCKSQKEPGKTPPKAR